MRRAITVAVFLALPACLVPQTVENLDHYAPPPEFGRPGWVRTVAKGGAWIGGVAGAVVAIGLLPINWPLSKLASDSFSEPAEQEFLLWPVVWGASAGHFMLGAPTDMVDFVFRRSWMEEPTPENRYELVPMEPPMGPDWRLPDLPPERRQAEPERQEQGTGAGPDKG